MPKRALTAAAVERLKPPKSGQVEHFDAGFPGLALRISHGGTRTWVVHFRHLGRQRRLTLGVYPALSLAEAREGWREARKQVDAGVDPAEEKAAKKRELPDTVAAAVDDFLVRYVRANNRRPEEIERLFEIHVLPVIGAKPIEAVTRRDIVRLLDRAEARGAGVRQNRVLTSTKRFFNWCVERGLLEASPAANVRPPVKETPRDRVLSDDEIVAFLRACRRMGQPFGTVFEVLLRTGQRRNEVAQARWDEFDLASGVWELPPDRVKNARRHRLPLPNSVIELIENLPSRGNSPFLFPRRFARDASLPERPISGFAVAKRRFDGLMLEELKRYAEERGEDAGDVTLTPWRLHDLRRTAATGLARLGTPVHLTEKVLNHVSGSTGGIVGIYQRHDHFDEMRSALTALGNFLDSLEDDEASDNVVPMSEARS